MLRSGEVFAGYEIERELGRGGMGSVYLARHPRLPRLVALKLLNRELFGDGEVRARFEREGDLVARLDHPNIVPVFDRGFDDDRSWIAMRFIDGVDAASLQAGNLPPAQAIRIIAETAKALDYAHRKGVLHRDVKPANILLEQADGEERIFLADFGIARLRDESTKLTQTGSFTATLAYAAPEQLSGHPLDGRCDQYSLACSLFRLLTGSVPFTAEHPVAVMQGHLNQPPPPVSALRAGLPPALDAVMARALAKHPRDRFESCTAFATAAQQALYAGPASRPSVPPASFTQASAPHATFAQASGPHATLTPPRPQHTRAGYQAPGAIPPRTVPPGSPSTGNTPPRGTPVPPRAPERKPKKKRLRGCLLTVALIIVVPLLALAGLLVYIDRASNTGTTVPTTTLEEPAPATPAPEAETTTEAPTTTETPADLVPSAEIGANAQLLSHMFPKMLPEADASRSFNAGTGYQGAACMTYASNAAVPARGSDEPSLGNSLPVWNCFGGNSKATYRFILYSGTADAQAVLDGLPANTKSTTTVDGHTYTNYLLNGSEPYRPRMVTAFGDGSGRGQVLMYSVGFIASEQDLLTWWKSAPLG
ncbi:serine/threonine-protein kinase [Nocardia inohanensis]|uniref:serine/threonine-protein kinase n=1 Tax=Nocardia inohanensis TaxID=209246 RepID=UPI00082E41A5|nr:serine/threonine-protein kinase [Nocardia inohanensis]